MSCLSIDGSTHSLSAPDAEEERAGSDVEEIEALARQQERLLSGEIDDKATDGSTTTSKPAGGYRDGDDNVESHGLTCLRECKTF